MNYRMILISAGFILHSHICFDLLQSTPMLPTTSLSISEAGSLSRKSIELSGRSVAVSKLAPQDADKDKQIKEVPVEFTYKMFAFMGKTRADTIGGAKLFDNRLEVDIRNNDPARTIIEVEYEIYSTDIKSEAEIAQIPVKDKVKIKPNEAKKRRVTNWSTEPIFDKCKPVTDCKLWARIRNIKFEDGSEWTEPIESLNSKSPSKKKK